MTESGNTVAPQRATWVQAITLVARRLENDVQRLPFTVWWRVRPGRVIQAKIVAPTEVLEAVLNAAKSQGWRCASTYPLAPRSVQAAGWTVIELTSRLATGVNDKAMDRICIRLRRVMHARGLPVAAISVTTWGDTWTWWPASPQSLAENRQLHRLQPKAAPLARMSFSPNIDPQLERRIVERLGPRHPDTADREEEIASVHPPLGEQLGVAGLGLLAVVALPLAFTALTEHLSLGAWYVRWCYGAAIELILVGIALLIGRIERIRLLNEDTATTLLGLDLDQSRSRGMHVLDPLLKPSRIKLSEGNLVQDGERLLQRRFLWRGALWGMAALLVGGCAGIGYFWLIAEYVHASSDQGGTSSSAKESWQTVAGIAALELVSLAIVSSLIWVVVSVAPRREFQLSTRLFVQITTLTFGCLAFGGLRWHWYLVGAAVGEEVLPADRWTLVKSGILPFVAFVSIMAGGLYILLFAMRFGPLPATIAGLVSLTAVAVVPYVTFQRQYEDGWDTRYGYVRAGGHSPPGCWDLNEPLDLSGQSVRRVIEVARNAQFSWVRFDPVLGDWAWSAEREWPLARVESRLIVGERIRCPGAPTHGA